MTSERRASRHARTVRSIAVVAWVGIALVACDASQPPGTGSSRSQSAANSPGTSGPPSGLIGLPDGRRLDLTCVGSGGPVVVLDAGLGNTSDVWIPVADRVGAFATVCRYDRAGLGRSDPRPEPHGAASAVSDLHALLGAAGLPAPYVVVGASYGGLVTQLFARTYPKETSGVVLVDAIPPQWNAGLESLLTPDQVAERHAIPNGEPITNEELRASDSAVEAAPAFPPVKLVVLRHSVPFPGDAAWPTAKVESLWATLQADLARLSPQSVEIQAVDAGHRIHQDQPQLVADAIHAVVDPALWPPAIPAPVAAFGAGAPAVAAGSIRGTVIYSGADGLRSATMDGTESRIVVPNDGMIVGEPSMDAAGRYLVYTRRPVGAASSGPQPDQATEVWVLDTKIGKGRMIASDGEEPAISPNGSSIVFGKEGHTWLIRPDGTGLRDLGEGGCGVWSPDSSHLAMCTADDTVVILRPSDGTREVVATGPGPNDPTAWSPDGMLLAVFSSRDGNGEIYVVGVDGGNERRLTTAPGNQDAVAWTSAGLIVTSSLPDADVSDWFLVDPSTGEASVIQWMRGVPIPIAYRSGP